MWFIFSSILTLIGECTFCFLKLFCANIKIKIEYSINDYYVYGIIYSRGVWNALFFIGCYWRTDMYKNGRSPAILLFFGFGRSTSVARCDQGGGLALPESCRGFCRSRYDAYNPKSVMKTVPHWRPTLMHLGCMIEKVLPCNIIENYLRGIFHPTIFDLIYLYILQKAIYDDEKTWLMYKQWVGSDLSSSKWLLERTFLA